MALIIPSAFAMGGYGNWMSGHGTLGAEGHNYMSKYGIPMNLRWTAHGMLGEKYDDEMTQSSLNLKPLQMRKIISENF